MAPKNYRPSMQDPDRDSGGLASRPGVVVNLPGRNTRLDELFEANNKRLVRFLASRLGSFDEAQEVAQEAYVRLMQRNVDLPDINMRALLFVTARNISIDRLRERKRHQLWLEESSGEDDDLDTITPERIVTAQQQIKLIGKLLRELPEKCRYAFIRYKLHGGDYAAIAGELGVTESMVRKHVIRAIAHCVSGLTSGAKK